MKRTRILAALLAVVMLGSVAAVTASALEANGTGILCRNWLTNDENYEFSDAYKTSVWYKNFTLLSLGKNQRNNVLQIAVSQLGYHEGNSRADHDGMNETGSKNYTEYGRLLIDRNGDPYDDTAYEWCACFVNWCLNQAHFDTASSEIGCWMWAEELKGMGMFQDSKAYGGSYTPKPADMIIFNRKGNNGGANHIGYVLYTTKTHVYTIEGNAGNSVSTHVYSLDDVIIIGYGTPEYDEGGVPTIDYAYTEGRPAGLYIVGERDLSLYAKSNGTRAIARVPVGSRVLLSEVEDKYAKVTFYDDKKAETRDGYIKASALYFMMDAATVTYDANGGEGAPEAQTFLGTEPAILSETVPTLEGDRFLGWSRIPYNCKVDYTAGESAYITESMTLYAVWEKHSLTLADKAATEGLIPEYTRPLATQNAASLVLSGLPDLSVLTSEGENTRFTTGSDSAVGGILTVTATKQTNDPNFLIPYADICRSLRLAPAKAEDAKYIILRVKDISLSNVILELGYTTEAGESGKLSATVTTQGEWEYLVFDMSAAKGWAGDIRSLRLDWSASAKEGDTLLIADFCFASTDAIRDAVLEGKYVYKPQPLLEPETEPETTVADPDVTNAPSTGAEESGNGEETEGPAAGGCASAISLSALLLSLAAGAALLGKRRD